MNRGNGPAYPSDGWEMPYDPNGNRRPVFYAGITIREELASRMLAGLLAHGVDYDRGRRDVVADEAVEWADALIARLSQPQEVPK